jgi:putative oxidoreductase
MLRALAGWLSSPGRTGTLSVAIVRIAVGAAFVQAGAGKFVNHDAYVRRFDRWGLPEPDLFSYAVGTLEVAGGLLLIAGILVRPVALVLAGNMVGALATAGRIDGGFDLVAPPILLALLIWIALDGGGRWRAVQAVHYAGGVGRPE